MNMKPSEGKVPVTGRSAKERAKAREASPANAERAAEKRNEAIRTRSQIVVGETAERLATDYQPARQLIAAAIRGSTPDVEARLTELAGGEEPLGARVEFLDLWERWRKMRALDGSLATAWTEMESLLVSAPELSDERFDEICASLETRVTEWEALLGCEHPVGRLLRMTNSGRSKLSATIHPDELAAERGS
jgi:hypothetical protein